MDRNSDTDRKFHFFIYKLAFILSFICTVSLAVACIVLYVNDEVILGEGQDSIISWLMMMSMGVVFFGVCSAVSLYEYMSLNKKENKGLPVFIISYISIVLALICGVMTLKTMGDYGPGLDEQAYFVEEADFGIVFPAGLSLIEETTEENYHRLYASSRSQTVAVHINTSWNSVGLTESEFNEYVAEKFRELFTKEIFDSTKTIRYDGFNAIRIVGKTESDAFNEFRAIYDILHGDIYIRVVVLRDNLSGRPGESFISDCDNIVGSIRFAH